MFPLFGLQMYNALGLVSCNGLWHVLCNRELTFVQYVSRALLILGDLLSNTCLIVQFDANIVGWFFDPELY